MDTIERSIPAPQIKIVKQRAARRQILRNRPPLASRAQDVHDPIHHLAHIDVAPVAATLGRPDKGADKRSFVVGQVAGISQVATVVSPTVLRRPHR